MGISSYNLADIFSKYLFMFTLFCICYQCGAYSVCSCELYSEGNSTLNLTNTHFHTYKHSTHMATHKYIPVHICIHSLIGLMLEYCVILAFCLTFLLNVVFPIDSEEDVMAREG